MKKRKNQPTGEIKIAVNGGRLRIQIPPKFFTDKTQGFIAVGLDDTELNRNTTKELINRIERDILENNFDESLDKYRVNAGKKSREIVKIVDVWERYLKYKKISLKPSTYSYLAKDLGIHIENCPHQKFSEALKLREWLLSQTTVFMVKRVLVNLNAAVKWAIKSKSIDLKESPFDGMAQDLPQHEWEKEGNPNALEQSEIIDVLLEFKFNDNPHYASYYPFVRFLFLTGCRPSEAIGLRIKDIDFKNKFVIFNGSLVRVRGKLERMEGSKNNKGRKFPIDFQLEELLIEQIGDRTNSDDLIFKSLNGQPINYGYFGRNIWQPVVNEVIDRPTTPYCCRDTFITLQLIEGIAAAVVCSWCDTSIPVIQRRYLDPVLSQSIAPVPLTAKMQ